jgi:probable F420-dependent oxidoreductase
VAAGAPFKVGVSDVVSGCGGRDAGFVDESVAQLEALGFDSFWAGEHLALPHGWRSDHPTGRTGALIVDPSTGEPLRGMMDSLVLLSYVAARTNALRVGTAVTLPTLRNPLLLAHQTASLDQVSKGRFEFGVGAGWLREEQELFGVDFARRGRLLDETLEALAVLWREDVASYEGTWFSFGDVVSFPKPVQQPHPPILVGGTSRAALRRAAALGDGWLGNNMAVADVAERLEILDRELASRGRSLGSFRVRVGVTAPSNDPRGIEAVAARIADLRQLGITEFMFSARFHHADHMGLIALLAELLEVPCR